MPEHPTTFEHGDVFMSFVGEILQFNQQFVKGKKTHSISPSSIWTSISPFCPAWARGIPNCYPPRSTLKKATPKLSKTLAA